MSTSSLAELLSPAVLARIDNYMLLARTVVDGFLSGLHRSRRHGFGTEFFQYRNYTAGDDLKYVDWKVLARRDRLYTKVFQEESNMTCTLLLDASASMGYQGQRAACSKLRYGCMLAASLAYLADRQGDSVGFAAYNHELVAHLPPRQRGKQLLQMITAMHALQPEHAAEHEKVWSYVGETLRGRSMIIVLSDFLEAEAQLPRLLRRFRAAGHECLAVQILDPDEQDLPFTQTVCFEDVETGRELVTAPEQVRENYHAAMATFCRQVRDACLSNQVDFLSVSTADALGPVLAAYLHRREAVL